ncbi:hypothetical protein [Leptospira noguchii]|uniref:hypothetical protein n=1 Tax=Leptospira noguchii TaxID=28182 RepID=UPI0015EEEC19|nr:hypothetical protein [Leptospira noguchii]UOG52451.1 hypothetical protein MAL09_18085 [Leptospira noguchii]
MNLILEFYNNLTRAESPVRLPVASRICPNLITSSSHYFTISSKTFELFYLKTVN